MTKQDVLNRHPNAYLHHRTDGYAVYNGRAFNTALSKTCKSAREAWKQAAQSLKESK